MILLTPLASLLLAGTHPAAILTEGQLAPALVLAILRQDVGGGPGGSSGSSGGGKGGGGGPGGDATDGTPIDGGGGGHGGGAGGPGDLVPPPGGTEGQSGGGGRSSPPPPPAPGSAGPSGPGGARPAPPATARTLPLDDVTHWMLWWRHNRGPYLGLRSHLLDAATLTGSDDFFLGQGSSAVDPGHLRPDPELLRARVIPALEAGTSSSASTSLRVECLLALARIGSPGAESSQRFLRACADLVGGGNQELREVAVVALGLHGDPASLPVLLALLRDEPSARELTRESRVPDRLRAFAGYALAMLAEADRDPDLRRAVAGAAMDVLEGEASATHEVEVAALHALALAPLELRPSRDGLRRMAASPHPDRRLLSLRSQVAWLLEQLGGTRRADGLARVVQAHVPPALARLCRAAPESLRETVCDEILAALRPARRPSNELQQGCAIALGLLGRAGAQPIDARIRDQLAGLVAKADAGARRLALISLGRLAGRAGADEDPWAGEAAVLALLRSTLAGGGSQLEPWAALALGVQCAARREGGDALDDAVLLELRDQTVLSRRPQDVGAFALALGLARAPDAVGLLLSRLEAVGEPDAKGQVAIALGLLGDRAALPALRSLLDQSVARPELLRSAAVGSALLGDKDLVPHLERLLAADEGRGAIGAVASALELIGDGRALAPLLELLESDSQPDAARAAAAAALGRVCDPRTASWEEPLSSDSHYMAATSTLTDGQAGILDREW